MVVVCLLVFTGGGGGRGVSVGFYIGVVELVCSAWWEGGHTCLLREQ